MYRTGILLTFLSKKCYENDIDVINNVRNIQKVLYQVLTRISFESKRDKNMRTIRENALSLHKYINYNF